MARDKFDLVIVAVQYNPDGNISQVRLFERRGPTFSDRLLYSREELMQSLHDRKKVFVGERVEFMAGTFNISEPVIAQNVSGQTVILTQGTSKAHDCLQGVPLF